VAKAQAKRAEDYQYGQTGEDSLRDRAAVLLSLFDSKVLVGGFKNANKSPAIAA